MAMCNNGLSTGLQVLLHKLTRTDPIVNAVAHEDYMDSKQVIAIRFVVLEKEYRAHYEVDSELLSSSMITEGEVLRQVYDRFIDIVQQKSNEVYENEEQQDDSGNDGSDDWASHISRMRVYGRQVVSHADSVT